MAVLHARDDLELAFTEAEVIISPVPCSQGLTLARCIEGPDAYLLLVQ